MRDTGHLGGRNEVAAGKKFVGDGLLHQHVDAGRDAGETDRRVECGRDGDDDAVKGRSSARRRLVIPIPASPRARGGEVLATGRSRVGQRDQEPVRGRRRAGRACTRPIEPTPMTPMRSGRIAASGDRPRSAILARPAGADGNEHPLTSRSCGGTDGRQSSTLPRCERTFRKAMSETLDRHCRTVPDGHGPSYASAPSCGLRGRTGRRSGKPASRWMMQAGTC